MHKVTGDNSTELFMKLRNNPRSNKQGRHWIIRTIRSVGPEEGMEVPNEEVIQALSEALRDKTDSVLIQKGTITSYISRYITIVI